MFGDTSDSFFGPDGNGISLFNAKGTPVSGDVTIHVQLWDVGTRVNEAPFVNTHTSPAEHFPVQLLQERNDGFTYPSVFGLIKVTITANNGAAPDMMQPAMMPSASATMAATAAATMSH